MGFLTFIVKALKTVRTSIRTIRNITKAYKERFGSEWRDKYLERYELLQVEKNIDEKKTLVGRVDKFSKARMMLIDDFDMTKGEATKLAREISHTHIDDIDEPYIYIKEFYGTP